MAKLKWALVVGSAGALGACVPAPRDHPAPAHRPRHSAPQVSHGPRAVADTPVRIGKPYTVGGKTYTPAPNPDYDRLGYASWYGRESGSVTANGELFRPEAITAAHTTLPLPTYIEVTSLDNGRVILVRVNDRGPFAQGGRILDLSHGAAKLLGVQGRGVIPVRVRVVEPAEIDKRRLREGRAARPQGSLSDDQLAELWRRWKR